MSDETDPRHGLLEQFHQLADQLRSDGGQPRDIAARPRQARDEPLGYGIAGSTENNGEGRRRSFGGERAECATGAHDDIDLERNQFGRENGEPLRLALRPAILDQDVATLGITEFT